MLGAAGLVLRVALPPSAGRATAPLRVLGHREAIVLGLVIDAVLPQSADRSPLAGDARVRVVDAILLQVPPLERTLLRALLLLLEQAPVLEGSLARFSDLDQPGRRAVLQAWQRSSFAARRLGFRSLKALVFLAHYRTPEAFDPIGYPGPVLPSGGGTPESIARYADLLAPRGAVP